MQNDPNFRPAEDIDPYERGFADKLYEDMEEPSFEPQDLVPEEAELTPYRRKRKKKHRVLRCLIALILVLVLLLGGGTAFLYFYADCPNADARGHRDDVATILIAGTDESGLRTDTLMLLCADRSEGTINLMSIPRDTKVNSTYWPQKINLAYQLNGMGDEGMYWLMDYVRQCVGFTPDGYILVDLDCFIDLVDLFGGVEFDVPCDMHYSDPSQDLYIDLEAGMQTLDGEEAMGVVRYRSGYAMADLQRVSVQRDFIMAAIGQWASVKNVTKLPKAMEILEDYCVTDLSKRNYLWFAWSLLLCGTDDMTLVTIPNYLSGDYVCIDASDDYLDLINDCFNPYEDEVEYGDLNIAS